MSKGVCYFSPIFAILFTLLIHTIMHRHRYHKRMSMKSSVLKIVRVYHRIFHHFSLSTLSIFFRNHRSISSPFVADNNLLSLKGGFIVSPRLIVRDTVSGCVSCNKGTRERMVFMSGVVDPFSNCLSRSIVQSVRKGTKISSFLAVFPSFPLSFFLFPHLQFFMFCCVFSIIVIIITFPFSSSFPVCLYLTLNASVFV